MYSTIWSQWIAIWLHGKWEEKLKSLYSTILLIFFCFFGIHCGFEEPRMVFPAMDEDDQSDDVTEPQNSDERNEFLDVQETKIISTMTNRHADQIRMFINGDHYSTPGQVELFCATELRQCQLTLDFSEAAILVDPVTEIVKKAYDIETWIYVYAIIESDQEAAKRLYKFINSEPYFYQGVWNKSIDVEDIQIHCSYTANSNFYSCKVAIDTD